MIFLKLYFVSFLYTSVLHTRNDNYIRVLAHLMWFSRLLLQIGDKMRFLRLDVYLSLICICSIIGTTEISSVKLQIIVCLDFQFIISFLVCCMRSFKSCLSNVWRDYSSICWLWNLLLLVCCLLTFWWIFILHISCLALEMALEFQQICLIVLIRVC